MKTIILSLFFIPFIAFSQSKDDIAYSVTSIVFKNSHYNNSFCSGKDKDIVCNIPNEYYIKKANCLIHNYNYKVEDFKRLATKEQYIVKQYSYNKNEEDLIFTTGNSNNKNIIKTIFPKCYKSDNEFFKIN